MESTKGSGLFLVAVALSIHVTMTSLPGVTLDVSMTEFKMGNLTIPMFRCTANSIGHNISYFLGHLITWSKIGRDGREKYLTINWDLTIHGKKGNYIISSDLIGSPSTSSPTPRKLYFILTKPSLTQDDHGEYICRLHDFDKNMLAEASVPVVMFDKGLALSPYKTEADSKTDVAVNCMFNTSQVNTPEAHEVTLYHVRKSGKSKKISTNGKLAQKSLSSRYTISTARGQDQLKHHILTIKSIKKMDAGEIKCELKKGSNVLTTSTADISVDTPELIPTPTFYLKMPVDSIAHFKCTCAIKDVNACRKHSMAWTFTNKHTGKSTVIYKDGMVKADPTLYQVIEGVDGALNLTINGVRDFETEGQYICWLHKKGSSKEIAHASIPVSVTPISMGLLALMPGYPMFIKLLCTVTGTQWDQHYLETHSIAWYIMRDGIRTDIALNSNLLLPAAESQRFSVIYFNSRHYSVLMIKDVTEADFGEYSCQLLKNLDNSVIKEESLSMYGKGNTTIFAGSYTAKGL